MIRNEWNCPECQGESIPHCICIANQEAAQANLRSGKERRTFKPHPAFYDDGENHGFIDLRSGSDRRALISKPEMQALGFKK